MNDIKIKDISHTYPGTRRAVLKNVNFTIRQGEFLTLLGPSGCGKTTILRIIAGLIKATRGKIYLGGEDITNVPPEKRGMGIVFQNYALFPNMSVADNITYSLRIRRVDKKMIDEKLEYYLELTGLTEQREKKIYEISGGQQQRTALARALITEPKVLLMDEPFSNLDAALRVKMRRELKEIQKKTGVTTLFITHDQQEALSISHRIAVMDEGVIQQIGTPEEVYGRPANMSVAQFTGAANYIPESERKALCNDVNRFFCRPEQLTLSCEQNDDPWSPEGVPAVVESVQFEGICHTYRVESGAGSYDVIVVNDGTGVFFLPGDRVYVRMKRNEQA